MMLFSQKMFLNLCMLIFVCMLAACTTKVQYHPVPKPTLAQIRAQYIEQLRAEGIQIITIGETMRLILLSDELFNFDSANIRPENRPLLKTIAHLMHTYDKVNVAVTAYTDNRGNIQRQEALTTRQAQTVANFLWAHGIDARLQYAVGRNRENPVDWNGSWQGRHNNRRIEISFRFYPEYIPYA